jgi:hypothetical protein
LPLGAYLKEEIKWVIAWGCRHSSNLHSQVYDCKTARGWRRGFRVRRWWRGRLDPGENTFYRLAQIESITNTFVNFEKFIPCWVLRKCKEKVYWINLLELWYTKFSRTIRLRQTYELKTWLDLYRVLTCDVRAVIPVEFSLVCRPLCGPGLGFSPFENASNNFFVDAGVKSSYRAISI